MGKSVLNEIIEVLRVFYKWPAVFAITNGYVDVLSKARTLWYIYDAPLGNVNLALMYEGIEDAPEDSDKPIELRFFEVALRHVESTKILLSFLDEPKDLHLYEAEPTGPSVKAYAKIKNGDAVFIDTTQLRQFIAQRLKTSMRRRNRTA